MVVKSCSAIYIYIEKICFLNTYRLYIFCCIVQRNVCTCPAVYRVDTYRVYMFWWTSQSGSGAVSISGKLVVVFMCDVRARSTALGLSFWSTAAGVPKLNRVTLQFSGKMERASLCHHCGQPLMMTPKRLESYNYICNVCTNRRRDADAARYIARKLADSLRRKGQPKPYPGVHFVRKVMIKCHGKSVLSGNANARHLCLVLQNPEQGYTVENAVLVTSGESLVLTRCAKLTCRNERE
jgi:hypothetical protein